MKIRSYTIKILYNIILIIIKFYKKWIKCFCYHQNNIINNRTYRLILIIIIIITTGNYIIIINNRICSSSPIPCKRPPLGNNFTWTWRKIDYSFTLFLVKKWPHQTWSLHCEKNLFCFVSFFSIKRSHGHCNSTEGPPIENLSRIKEIST